MMKSINGKSTGREPLNWLTLKELILISIDVA
jgi:hypothetical protein